MSRELNESSEGAEKAWLDVAIFRCPSCGRLYAEAAWYAVELEASIECGTCGAEFCPSDTLLDRVMLEFEVSGGRVVNVSIVEVPEAEGEGSTREN